MEVCQLIVRQNNYRFIDMAIAKFLENILMVSTINDLETFTQDLGKRFPIRNAVVKVESEGNSSVAILSSSGNKT